MCGLRRVVEVGRECVVQVLGYIWRACNLNQLSIPKTLESALDSAPPTSPDSELSFSIDYAESRPLDF